MRCIAIIMVVGLVTCGVAWPAQHSQEMSLTEMQSLTAMSGYVCDDLEVCEQAGWDEMFDPPCQQDREGTCEDGETSRFCGLWISDVDPHNEYCKEVEYGLSCWEWDEPCCKRQPRVCMQVTMNCVCGGDPGPGFPPYNCKTTQYCLAAE